jgi:hypothetical protein
MTNYWWMLLNIAVVRRHFVVMGETDTTEVGVVAMMAAPARW